MLNLLNRTCGDLTDIKTKKLLYITWVRSRLEYASVVWSPYTKINIVKLEQIQRRATRLVIRRDFSEHERLEKLNLLPLQYRREVNDLLFFFKCFKKPYILDIFNYVSFRCCEKSIRNVDYFTLNVPFSKTEAFKDSYFIRFCRLWNNLPLDIRGSSSLSSFRMKVLAFYYNKFYVTFLS